MKSTSRHPIPLWLYLLGISVLINYVDRGNLPVAAPLLKNELHISNVQIGVLVTAFFWTYTVVLVLSGWIVDRVNVNWVLAAGFLVWSVATVATGLSYTFGLLLASRMLLGIGESVAFPSYCKIIARNIAQEHRGIANAIILAGLGLGPAIGTYGCGLSMARYGWRPVFIVIGLVSLLWIVPWLRYMPRNHDMPHEPAATAPTRDIFRQRNFWAVSAGHFCSNYSLYFMIVWLPLYLVGERHLSMQQMAGRAALYYVMFAISAPITGGFADALIRAGYDVSVVRKASVGIGHTLIVIGVLAVSTPNPHLALAGLILMGLGGGSVGPNVYVFAQTLAGPAMIGKWMGWQNGLGNLAGVVVGPLTGWIVDRTGHFGSAFTVCAAVTAFGGIAWVLLVGRLQQTVWQVKPEPARAIGQAA